MMTTQSRADTTLQVASFHVAELLLGLDLRHVHEVNRPVKTTPVPHAPRQVRGVVNLRGDVVTVLDLRSVLGMPEIAETRDTRCVIVATGGERTGLLVDRVADVLTLTGDQVEAPPANIGGIDGRFYQAVCRLDDQLLILLDIEAVLREAASTQGTAGGRERQ